MIAKQGWFTRRKYSGWGFTPKTWQGWVYTAVLILPFVAMTIFNADAKTQLIVSGIWAIFLIAAFIDIMASIKKDEREKVHEAISERNALWAIILTLTAGIAYQSASGIIKNSVEIDPVIIIALLAGLAVKAISNIYLDKKD